LKEVIQIHKMEEVAIISSSSDSNIYVIDPRNGTQLAVFKNNTSGPNGIAIISSRLSTGGIAGPGDLIVSTQNKGLALHFWRWGQEQPAYKCHTPEKIACLTVTTGGFFCLGGSLSGTIHVWEVGTGSLVSSFEAHYRAVNCVTMAGANSDRLITGGEDALVRAWTLADLLEEEGTPPKPQWSGNAHSLPVTVLVPTPTLSRLVSASMDRTAKVWEVSSGQMIFSITCRSSLRSLVLDPLGSQVYLGGSNGDIFEMDLNIAAVKVNAPHAATNLASGGASKESLQLLKGHSTAVTSIAFSRQQSYLISTSEDGCTKVWHPQSRQCIKTFTLHKGASSQVLLVPRPAEIFSLDQQSLSSSRKKTTLPTPFQPFKKYKRTSPTKTSKQKSSEHLAVDHFLDSIPCFVGNVPDQHFFKIQTNMEQRCSSFLQKDQPHQNIAVDQNVEEALPAVKELQVELQRLKDENTRWQKVNTELMKKFVS